MLQVSVTSKHAGRHVTLELLNWFLAQVQTSIPQWQADDTLECEVDCCGTCWSCTSVRNANNRRPTEAGGRRKKMLGTLCKYNTGGKGQKWSHVRRTCRSISTADFMKKKRLTRLFCLEKFQICFYEPHIELFGCFFPAVPFWIFSIDELRLPVSSAFQSKGETKPQNYF